MISPQGEWIADWYQLSGGGAAGWSADYVRVRRMTDNFSVSSDYVFSIISGDQLELRWTSETELHIEYPDDGTPTRVESHWNSVSLSYSTFKRKERGVILRPQ